MARGTPLDVVRSMLRSECGENLSPNSEVNDELSQLVANKQVWLSTEWDWPFLQQRWDATCSSIFTTIPTTTIDSEAYLIDFDRSLVVNHKQNEMWHPLEYGIGEDEYNSYDSRAGETSDFTQRWMLHSPTTFEVWPVPATAQTIRFSGYRRLTSLKMGGDETTPTGWDDGALLDLDDLLIVYFCAAERLARRNQRDAASKMQLAMERMRMLRAMNPSRPRRVVLGGAADEDDERPVKLVALG